MINLVVCRKINNQGRMVATDFYGRPSYPIQVSLRHLSFVRITTAPNILTVIPLSHHNQLGGEYGMLPMWSDGHGHL